MIEVIAAAVGVAFGASLQSIGTVNSRYREGREAVVRLTLAVETLADRFEEMHQDIKADRDRYINKMGAMETRLTKIEARLDQFS